MTIYGHEPKKVAPILAQNEDRDLVFFNPIKLDLTFHLRTLPKHLGIIYDIFLTKNSNQE